jgi:hypothetical protein
VERDFTTIIRLIPCIVTKNTESANAEPRCRNTITSLQWTVLGNSLHNGLSVMR